jgi:hypothetical protein
MFGKQLRLEKLNDVDQSLAILAIRSRREIHKGENPCGRRDVTIVADDIRWDTLDSDAIALV